MKLFKLGLESIAFQNGDFNRELIDIITKARAGAKDKQAKEQVAKDIALCTAKHTNISVTVEFIDQFNNACIFPALLAREGVHYSSGMADMMKNYYDHVTKLGRGRKMDGMVNAATSKIGGEFASISLKSYYDTNFIFSNRQFSAAGAAAVILHETGHAFTFFEYLADTVMINLHLQEAYQSLMEATSDGEVRMIVERTRKTLKLNDPADWSKDITKTTDSGTVIHILAAEAVLMRNKTDNKMIYTQDVAEEMAEIFCVRHGGSEGLIDVRRYFANNFQMSEANFGVMSSAVIAVIGALSLPVLGPIGAAIVAVGLSGMVVGNAAAASLPEFTKFSQTIGKVRNQMVERLKQANLPPDVVRECLRNIDLAITAMKETPDDKMPALVIFWDFFRSGKRSVREWREYTDKLERMATNDLFVRASSLALKSQTT